METGTIELDAEYRILREEAGLLDRSGRGKLLVSGADAAEFLQGQLTNDVEALRAGDGCYACLLDRKGRVQADMRVLRLDQERIGSLVAPEQLPPEGADCDTGGSSRTVFWIDTEGDALATVSGHLDMYRIGRQVELTDLTAERAILSLIGPRTAELLGDRPLGPEHSNAERSVAGIDCVVCATDAGADLLCDAGDRERLAGALLEAGAERIGERAAEILRVESGRPRFGAEITTKTIPEEAGINERAVSFEKGCYIGQETVARLHYRGKPNRRLRRLRLSGPARAGDPVRAGERELGTIGTAVLSPAHGHLALAILRREAEPGAAVEVGEPPVEGIVEEIGGEA